MTEPTHVRHLQATMMTSKVQGQLLLLYSNASTLPTCQPMTNNHHHCQMEQSAATPQTEAMWSQPVLLRSGW